MGFCYFDSVCDYGNEKEVGEGIVDVVLNGLCICDDFWIIFKFWNIYYWVEYVCLVCECIFWDFGVDYFDLYLVYFFIVFEYVLFELWYFLEWFLDLIVVQLIMKLILVLFVEIWGVMEDLVDVGFVKQIGVCNYNSGFLYDFMVYVWIKFVGF